MSIQKAQRVGRSSDQLAMYKSLILLIEVSKHQEEHYESVLSSSIIWVCHPIGRPFQHGEKYSITSKDDTLMMVE